MSDWLSLPNLHPAVVHFPIALLPMAVLVDLAAVVRRRFGKGGTDLDWLARSASLLYVLAAISALGVLRTGEQAADSFVDLPAAMQPRIAAHSDTAHWAAYLLAAVAVLHLGVRFLERRTPSDLARAGLVLLGIANVVLVARAADLGGALVYQHGLGVVVGVEKEGAAETVTEVTPGLPAAPEETGSTDPLADARSRLRSGGDDDAKGLEWHPRPPDGEFLYRLVDVAPGFSRDTASWVGKRSTKGKGSELEGGLPIEVSGDTLLLLPGVFADVQVEADVDLSGFEGTVGLAHHVEGSDQRGLFALSTAGEASLVDLRGGSWTVLDEQTVEPPASRIELAVSSAGRHLKGMLDGGTVVHGHVAPPAEGRCGLFLEGEGRLRILAVRVIPL